ncbi:hypothetical protein [Deinococcus petrolearius]|uniref:Uncharacterized protein n=1 Tax=Deinococcus petrolearius TaxID=1751295 RepID=A0ABW1DRN1_9DEIO
MPTSYPASKQAAPAPAPDRQPDLNARATVSNVRGCSAPLLAIRMDALALQIGRLGFCGLE